MTIDTSTTRPTSTRLQAEWQRVRTDPAALRTARSWGVTDRPFDDLDELLVLAGAGRPTSPEGEATLVGLVGAARTSPLAGRIVLQRLLPGLLATARRRRAARGADAFEELVAAAWEAILTYDVERRRPACLAAALVWAADNRAFRRSARPLPIGPEPFDAARHAAAVTEAHPLQELAEVVGDARRAGLTDDDLALLRQLLGGRQIDVAADLRVTARTIRNRRDRLVARLQASACDARSPVAVGRR
ncbi:MAG: hypothetical protein MUE78_00305 [Ilumatobacteraceae bacterium]|jgi:hypothetical protein|nr:hypothetical protein [Ilumatobacteraceae bacterium]